jgi:hypothetical protein
VKTNSKFYIPKTIIVTGETPAGLPPAPQWVYDQQPAAMAEMLKPLVKKDREAAG